MTGDVEPRDIRVSDAEREHVGQLLQRAVGQGRLTIGEFAERMDTAMAARTRSEPSSTVILEIDKSGSTKIIVPEGATVDITGLHVTMGSVKVFTARRIEPGPVHFVITGRSTMGEVRIVRRRARDASPRCARSPQSGDGLTVARSGITSQTR